MVSIILIPLGNFLMNDVMETLLYLHCPYCNEYQKYFLNAQTLMARRKRYKNDKSPDWGCFHCNKYFNFLHNGKWVSR